MKIVTGLTVILVLFSACNTDTATGKQKGAFPLIGSWKLLTGTIIQKGDTTVTDYTIDKSFVKIINETHFAFLLHDLQKGKDSSSAAFVAGGGRYELKTACTRSTWNTAVTGHPRDKLLLLPLLLTMTPLFKAVSKKLKRQVKVCSIVKKYVRIRE